MNWRQDRISIEDARKTTIEELMRNQARDMTWIEDTSGRICGAVLSGAAADELFVRMQSDGKHYIHVGNEQDQSDLAESLSEEDISYSD